METVQHLVKCNLKDDPETLYHCGGDASAFCIHPEQNENVSNPFPGYKLTCKRERNGGLTRSASLRHMFVERVFNMSSEVEEVFDPERLFNPFELTDTIFVYPVRVIKEDNEH